MITGSWDRALHEILCLMTGFLHSPKGVFLWTFHKLKWHEAKKWLPLVYTEKLVSVPKHKNALLGFSDTLRYILVTVIQNRDKAQMLTHSSKPRGLAPEPWTIISGEGTGWYHPGYESMHCPSLTPCKTAKHWPLYLLFMFLNKNKNPLQITFD